MAYMHRILRAVTVLPKADLSAANIAHDDWCLIYKGGECNCVPDITVRIDGKTFVIDEQGAVLQQHDQ